MSELVQPFISAWRYVERVGGFPGQVFFCVMVVIVVLGGLTWYGNRR
jgi:hypothetical protein